MQACVEDALSHVADHPVRVHCAGRTDAGVHALRQVIHFDTTAMRSPQAWVLGANGHLPDDVSLTWAVPVDPEFHARYSATGRAYRYFIMNRRARPGTLQGLVAWECRPLDPVRMVAGARDLIGEHDFTSYRAIECQAKSPIREVRRLEIRRQDELIVVDIEANSFLYHMVRNIVGVLSAIGAGRNEPEWAKALLAQRDRTLGGVTAPAEGLYLVDVNYPARFQVPERRTSASTGELMPVALQSPPGGQ